MADVRVWFVVGSFLANHRYLENSKSVEVFLDNEDEFVVPETTLYLTNSFVQDTTNEYLYSKATLVLARSVLYKPHI